MKWVEGSMDPTRVPVPVGWNKYWKSREEIQILKKTYWLKVLLHLKSF